MDTIFVILIVLLVCALARFIALVMVEMHTENLRKQQREEAARKRRAEEEALRFEKLLREQMHRDAEMRRLQEQLHRLYAAKQNANQYRTQTPPPRRKGVVTRGDVRKARILLAQYGGYKCAVKKTHPDYGGNANAFREVIEAKKLVDRFPHVT